MQARVMLCEANDDDGDILHGVWEMLPWGYNDVCYAVTLNDTDQRLHVWLEGVTEREPPPRTKNARLELQR